MKNMSLVLLLFIGSIGLLACTNSDSGKSVEQKIHDCMWDETGVCQNKLAEAMNDPSKRAVIEQEIAAHPELAQKFQVTGDALWQKVQAHAQEVQDRNQALASNPDSSFYDPPQAARSPASDPAMAALVNATPNAPTAILPASVPKAASSDGVVR